VKESKNRYRGSSGEKIKEELANFEGEGKIISSLDMLEEFDKLPPIQPISSGLKTLDEWCDGFVPGELIVLSGRPKSGKSLLMRTFIEGFCKQGMAPIVFTYEEQPRQFLGNFDNGSHDIMFYMPSRLESGDVFWIMDRMMESKIKKGTKIAFIDHAQYLYEMSEKSSSLNVGAVARHLKNIARDEDYIVFLIWHAYKAKVECVEDLDQEMLRDSGMTAGELDHLFLMYRNVKSSGISQIDESFLKIECTRRTGVMKRVIPIRKEGGRFVETGIDF
jgi:replicative DNA helicase